jgi:SAM-dependent methyltransferase
MIDQLKDLNFVKKDDFYECFQRDFRGGRYEIIERLSKYKIYLDPLLESKNKQVIDLGCGRGEWLELLGAWGFEATGYDLDDGMLEHCKKNHLNAHKGDALQALKEMKDGSKAVISSFHVIEHLKFQEIRLLFSECYRVLMPGGILILETPNTENILVMTETFWLDPSHVHPLPPGLLSFLAKYHGFDLNVIIRLNENFDDKNDNNINLGNLFYSVSPDCALIALKSEDDKNYQTYKNIFQFRVGRDLKYFINKFDERLQSQDILVADMHNELRDLKNRILIINIMALKNILKRIIRGLKNRMMAFLDFSPKAVAMDMIFFSIRNVKKNKTIFKIARKIVSFIPSLEDKILSILKNKKDQNAIGLRGVAIYHDEYVPTNRFSDKKAETVFKKINLKG